MMLELRNIYKTYLQGKLEVPVLKDISLSVEKGEYVAIMGPSGSGKTTLMNLIGCLDVPTSGEYLLEGEDLSHQSDGKLSEVRLRAIGFVFQSFYLLPRQSALENVALPLLYAGVKRKDRLETARKALERVGLADRADFKPTQLSGGQCQRVAIARAIVNDPKLLLADEPTGALDTASGEQVMEIFQKLSDDGVTIVMITHEPEIAAHAHRILHIRDGRLVDSSGNPIASAPASVVDAASKEPESIPEEPEIPSLEQEEPPIPVEAPTISEEEPEIFEEVLESSAAEEETLMEEPEAPAEEVIITDPHIEENGQEQLSFNIWNDPASFVPPQPEEPLAEGKTEELPNEDQTELPLPGQFGAPLKLDLDLTQIFAAQENASEAGGFQKPIPVELDSLQPKPEDPSGEEGGL